VVNKTDPSLLSVGQQIEADVLLGLQDQASGIVLRLFERGALPMKLDLAAFRFR
jgi:hypothetical protein